MKPSRTAIIVLALPGLTMLALFYSLAIHMRCTLGAWPMSIGNQGFPPALITHGNFAWKFSSGLALASIYFIPAAILVCLLVARWRRLVVYLVLYAFFYAVCWGLMLLAPAGFLNWWWD